jgi:phage shock protein PspC (stress-responsive transcriptional regulator)
MRNKLYRSRNDRVLAGVCAGLAEYFKIDPVLIRVIFIAAALGGGFGLLAYLIFWIVTPESPYPGSSGSASTSDENADYSYQTTAATNSKSQQQGSVIAGSILILLGGLFLAEEFLPDFDFEKYWPLILIFIGIGLLIGAFGQKNNSHAK